MEKIELVVAENWKYESQVKSELIAVFDKFGLSRVRGMD